MKKLLAALSIFAVAATAGAQNPDAEYSHQIETTRQLIQTNNQLTAIHAELLRLRQDLAASRPNSNTPICWHESKAYGLGDRLDTGLICTAGATPNNAHWEHPSAWK